MKFAYTALTKDNKKITGVLEAENLEGARAQLHKMGVAVISIKETTEEQFQKSKQEQEQAKKEKGIGTFQFSAIDPNKKQVDGTIDATDAFSAYKRLRLEYQFQITELHAVGASEFDQKNTKLAFPKFEERIKEEQILSGKKVEKKEEKVDLINADSEMNEEFVAEIDKVVRNAKEGIATHKDLFSRELLMEIQNTIGELERIRTSNNIKHITEVSNELYDLLGNPDQIEGEVSDQNYQQLMADMEESSVVQQEYQLYDRAVKMTRARKLFSGITTRLKDLTAADPNTSGSGFMRSAKLKIHQFLDKATPKQVAKKEIVKVSKKPKTKLGSFIQKFNSYLRTKSPILRQVRKQEFKKAFKELIGKGAPKPKAKETALSKEIQRKRAASKELIESAAPIAQAQAAPKKERDYGGFLFEVDSFIGWLLFFYILYFFIAGFSLEKGKGVNPEFILKTLNSPLILNITLFLLLLHFILRFRNLHLQRNAVAGLFLFFFSMGLYTLLIVNF